MYCKDPTVNDTVFDTWKLKRIDLMLHVLAVKRRGEVLEWRAEEETFGGDGFKGICKPPK